MKLPHSLIVGLIPAAALLTFILILTTLYSASPRVIWIPMATASDAGRTIRCDDKKAQKIRVGMGRITVINFPFKPKDVVPGEVSFDFKKIKNDLVIKAVRAQAATNLVVYLEDRRCTFDLVTVAHGGDDILIVRDVKDDQMEPIFHD